MILEFSVKNFRSINEMQTLSFRATGLKSSDENHFVDENNIVTEANTKILKTLGVYGPNASGKSNIIKALDYFLSVLTQKVSNHSILHYLFEPFLYQSNPKQTESFFQIIFIYNSKKYRYGFTVQQNLEYENEFSILNKISSEIITSEWLFGEVDKNMVAIFTRRGLEVDKSKLQNAKIIPELSTDQLLFLTFASAFNVDGICNEIREFFELYTTSNIILGNESFRRFSILALKHKKQELLHLLSIFNLNFDDVFINDEDKKLNINEFTLDKINLLKKNNSLINVKLNLEKTESKGTQKLFDLAGLLLITFESEFSGLVILDEIDSNFHPALLIKLIGLFNNPKINKSNSQLLFTSHDTNLLQPNIMRRDQFYFTEKTETNATKLFSLSDLKGIRNDADFAKQYLAGFYGALPILSDYTTLNESKDE